MNLYSWLQLVFYFAVLLLLAKPLGTFMARVYQGERTFLDPVLRPGRAAAVSTVRRGSRRRHELEDLRHRGDALQRPGADCGLRTAATARSPAAQSARPGRGTPIRPGTRPSVLPPTRTGRATAAK